MECGGVCACAEGRVASLALRVAAPPRLPRAAADALARLLPTVSAPS